MKCRAFLAPCSGRAVHGAKKGRWFWAETCGYGRNEVSVQLGVQEDHCVWGCATCMYCFSMRVMLWCYRKQKMLNIRLPAEPVGVLRYTGTSVGMAIRWLEMGTKSIKVLYLVLGILCQLSIWDSTIALLIFLLLFTDQKLLWRPAKFSTFDFSLRWLNYNGWQAVFELTATVKVWRVREYLMEERQGELELINQL